MLCYIDRRPSPNQIVKTTGFSPERCLYDRAAAPIHGSCPVGIPLELTLSPYDLTIDIAAIL
jgi:hypothetical protein